MKLGKLVKDLKVKAVNRVQAAKYGKIDYGIVKVALMVAALDGDVSDDELKAIDVLLKKCRGYSIKSAATVLDEAIRSAGYLMLLGKRAKDSQLVKAFIAEAKSALPEGFAFLSVEEIRRAVVTWIALGMSDGDYSMREKKCIEALRTHFAELQVEQAQLEEARWDAMMPAFRQVYGADAREVKNNLFPRDFVTRVERLVAQYGDSVDGKKALEELMGSV